MKSAPLLVTQSGSEHDETLQPPRHVMNWPMLKRMVGLMSPYRPLRNRLLITVVLRTFQLPLISWLTARILAGLAEGNASPGVLTIQILVLTAVILLTLGTFHLRMFWALNLGEAIVSDLRAAVYRHLQKLTMDYYHRTKTGRLISRMVSDTEAVRIGVQDVLFISLVQGGQMLGAAVLMAWIQWRLFLILAAMAPIFWGVNRVFRSRFAEAYRAMRESFARVTATLAESVAGVRVTQGFVREETNARAFDGLVRDHATYNTRASHLQGVFLPLLEINTQGFLAALLAVGGWLALRPEPEISAADLVYFFFLAQLFFSPIQVLGTQYTNLMEALTGAERVFALLDTPPAWQDAPDSLTPPPMRGQVEFRNVGFHYPGGPPVLHDISFTAEPGQLIALVGTTGCGKSTLASLLARFHLPTTGKIFIDGHDLDQVRTGWINRHLGFVTQQNFLFGGTVARNLRIGRPEATDADLRQAMEKLGLADWADSLPRGLATPVGEGGKNLSLGQRQLVCIARAMLADPRLLILDEATSSIDPATENRIQRALGALLKGRTALVIAHRLSTIRQADCILVMSQGRIVERGRHEELLKNAGLYATMHREFIQGK